MKSISTLFWAAALFGTATVIAGDPMAEGCFSSATGLTFNATYQFNSKGKCGGACQALNAVTFATQNEDCYCGKFLPPVADSINNSTCSFSCPGYPSDMCGGTNAFSLYSTGLSTTVSNADTATTTAGTSKVSPSSTTTAKPSVVTVGGQTIVVTASPLTSASSSTSSPSTAPSSGASKAGIAAGVIVGLVLICAIVGGLFLFFRNKQRREIEEEHRRQAAMNSLFASKPSSAGTAGPFTDMRLDPAVMAQRRMSDGSIADNQDYSRRILKVTNA